MTAIRILIMEDVEDDIDLLRATLDQSGLEYSLTAVDSESSLDNALARDEFDVAVVDFVLPKFGGLDAMRAMKERRPQLPIILFTGALDEATLAAVDGNADVKLHKRDLAQLPAAITSVVHR